MIPMDMASVPDPEPWIGSAYQSQPLRLLVLGESHKMSEGKPAPTAGPDYTLYTKRAIKWRIAGPEHSQFFGNVEQIMFGEPQRLNQPGRGEAEVMARGDFWHSVAFANFVPRIMASQQDTPQPQDWVAGRPRFIRLIDALQPDLVCLFSKTAFNRWYMPWGEAPSYDGLELAPEDLGDLLIRYDRPIGRAVHVGIFDHASRTNVAAARERFHLIVERVRASSPARP